MREREREMYVSRGGRESIRMSVCDSEREGG